MKKIVIDQTELVRALAQLTHAEIDPAQWGWVVAFDPADPAPQAAVQLPDRINSQGGLQPPHRANDRDDPEAVPGGPEPAMVSPFDFVDLEPGFKWNGEIPDMANRASWSGSAMQDAANHIRRHLRQEVEIDGVRYQLEYW